MYDDDMEILKRVKQHSKKRNKNFSNAINSKNLTEEEMDDLFLSY